MRLQGADQPADKAAVADPFEQPAPHLAGAVAELLRQSLDTAPSSHLSVCLPICRRDSASRIRSRQKAIGASGAAEAAVDLSAHGLRRLAATICARWRKLARLYTQRFNRCKLEKEALLLGEGCFDCQRNRSTGIDQNSNRYSRFSGYAIQWESERQ